MITFHELAVSELDLLLGRVFGNAENLIGPSVKTNARKLKRLGSLDLGVGEIVFVSRAGRALAVRLTDFESGFRPTRTEDQIQGDDEAEEADLDPIELCLRELKHLRL